MGRTRDGKNSADESFWTGEAEPALRRRSPHSLPAQRAKSSRPLRGASTLQFPKGSAAPARHSVLLVEDEPELKRALSRALRRIGFSIVAVSDGNAAVAELKQHSFDAILSDIELPGPSGVDLLRVVRAYDLDVPVILVTGLPRLETAIEAVQLGALEYLVKPVQLEALEEALTRASKLHQVARIRRDALRLHGEAERMAGDRAGLLESLERACSTLSMVYQPIVDVAAGKVFAYEALVRSEEPSLPTPLALFAAARRLDRMSQLGLRIREIVGAGLASTDNDELLFYNMDPDDLTDETLFGMNGALAPFSSRVVLEFGERGAFEDVADFELKIEKLRGLGYHMAIDDFGGGSAGLKTFAAIEPDFVKIDMALVRGLNESALQKRLVKSTILLCRDLKCSAIAEGVETAQEFHTLVDLGCELMQGYFFAKPEPKRRPVKRLMSARPPRK
jgi:EAL domain-containing protein (putative c-di-GMP-specific phosphodiesterase class I)